MQIIDDTNLHLQFLKVLPKSLPSYLQNRKTQCTQEKKKVENRNSQEINNP